ncbi:MAG: hypothetical protein JXM79_08745 [Sedimentisphaerales bacterium]|nr:hypothetical protein [Sedimentisphaerales bacterium]
MHSQMLENNRGKSLRICRWVGYFVLILIAGCSPSEPNQETTSTNLDTTSIDLDLTREGQHTSGAWTYDYSITAPGTRSEGYHGNLSYNQNELPNPMHINDFYETPWGRLYWVGKPVVLFGAHGWMPNPLAREPVGQALINPAIVHSERFMVHLKVVAPEELYTPDRLEKDPNVLAALKRFGLTEAHVQYDWFTIGSDPITLHDTKRWGTFKVCRSDRHELPAPSLEFTCTTELTVDTAPRSASLMELMAAPEFPDKPSRVSLSPQADTLQPIKCTLTSFVGEPLILYVICRIEDQGPKPPWKVPGIRVWETKEQTQTVSIDPNQSSQR